MKQRTYIRFLVLVLALVLLMLPVSAEEENVVIVLDPGHGGTWDPGTVSKYDGVEVVESELNLKIARYCREYLEYHYENVQVLLTRETDVEMDLKDRLDFAEEAGADYLLSIHINANTGYAQGALAIVPRGRYRPEQAAASKTTAEAILAELEQVGMVNLGTEVRLSDEWYYPDGTWADYFAIVRGGVYRDIPSIIMEHGFLDNEDDYRNFLSSDEQLAALGRADALGLAKTLGLKERRHTSAERGDTPFVDVLEGEWYYDAVTYVWEQGLMKGISDSHFAPLNPATRAMAVTLLYRMEGEELAPENCTFADVEPGSWYHAPVEWAYETGITNGVGGTEFAPGRNVTREQFVTFLHRYAGEPEAEMLPEQFSDWETVNDFARNAVAWAVEKGILKGHLDGTIQPQRELSRSELAALIQRFHVWKIYESGETELEWTLNCTEKMLYPGESFELRLTNQFGMEAQVECVADCEGVVEIDGSTITALSQGCVLLSCEWDGEWYSCFVEVLPEPIVWTISHEDVTIKVGERFYLKLRGSNGETAQVEWTASKNDIVSIDGNQITGKAKGTVTVSCEHDGQHFECIVRVKRA